MWDTLLLIMVFAIVANPVLDWIQKRWRRRRSSQTIAALNRGESVHIRCATRFRNSGGGRHRASLAVRAEGVFLSTVDGTVSELQLGTPGNGVEIVAEFSMMVCDVAGRQLEVLLPAGESHLFKAVAVSLLDHSNTHPTTAEIVP
ncbi:hypothetical protein [Streptomyces sp. NBC_01353]|uniref:hypothetical protein n=1 Tax=Streptomyces sp. NBC_01353 TaxID=2903835 RepID=UPI002E36E64D|nr:hypothetical protein [Streptomyces sp. NBC_01353]